MIKTQTLAATTIATLTLLTTLQPQASANIPLQQGSYEGSPGYIVIARKGQRYCYLGANVRRSSVASLHPAPQNSRVFRVHGFQGTTLYQQNKQTLIFGGAEYTRRGGVGDTSGKLGQCLNSSDAFIWSETY